MSRLVDNRLGTYNLVKMNDDPAVLFLCPDCGEWLPLDNDHMNGAKPINHESRIEAARFCSFQGSYPFGSELLATMQSRILFGLEPTRPESVPPMYVRGPRDPSWGAG